MTDHSLFPILGKLKRQTWRSDNPNLGECQCPAHDDSTNSLHITIKHCDDGQTKLMFHCHAGCTVPEILRALGEGFSSLFPDRTRAPKPSSSSAGKKGAGEPKLVKVYDYHDADGNVLHQTLRWEPKNFTQRRRAEPNQVYQTGGKEYRSFRDPQGNWWLNTLKGIEPVIYRLPEILKADLEKFVFLCEGEKDADNLRKAFGVYATTVPMGSGKWRASYAQYFIDRRVIVVPDFDKPRKGQTNPAANAGFDGARRVAAELVTVCRETRICYPENLFNLTPKWDLSDWIDAGGTKQQFIEACNAAPILHPDHPGLIPAGMTTDDAAAASSSPAGSAAGAEQRQIANIVETSEGFEPLPMSAIFRGWNAATGGWPKVVGKCLFAVEDRGAESPEVQFLRTTPAVFGWAGSKTGKPIAWARTSGCHSKEEFFNELHRSQERFEAIEYYPHEPRIESHFYAVPKNLPESTGFHLTWLLNRFSPSTDIDRDLILAFLLTPFWGGPGGSRPAFAITTEDGGGQGVGKTTLSEIVGELCGGVLSINSRDDDAKTKERLLSPDGRNVRVVVADNIKSLRLSWAEFEALVTSKTISGKELYVGESRRPNTLTFTLTMNGLELSRDMAQRCIIVLLAKPKHLDNWKEETYEFISKHRWNIISDILCKLREPPKPLMKYSRWGQWERDVLSRLPIPEDAQKLILERQASVDADGEEAELVEHYFANCLRGLHYDPEKAHIFIPNRVACDWLAAAFKEKLTVQRATQILKMHTSTGAIKRMTYHRLSAARGFVWKGECCLPYEQLNQSLESSIAEERRLRESSGTFIGSNHENSSGQCFDDITVPSDFVMTQ